MNITKIERVLRVSVVLQRGVDYNEEDLESFFTPMLKELKPKKLTEIAKKNCFDKWAWSGHEKNEQVEAIFEKVEVLGNNDKQK